MTEGIKNSKVGETLSVRMLFTIVLIYSYTTEIDNFSGFSIEGPSKAKIDCQDNGDGSADVRYYPLAPGEYAVHILCDNEDIPKSPYIANVIPSSDFYPDKVSGYCKREISIYG